MSSYYKEVQSFCRPTVWILVMLIMVPTNGTVLYGFYKQIVVGEPWGITPTSDNLVIIIVLSILLFSLAIFWFILNTELILEVRDKSIYYQLRPLFKQKVLHFSNVQSWAIKPINPFFDFGGYGLRITPKTKAYILSGKNAIILKPKLGKQIAIDTKNPLELESAMKKEWQPACRRHGDLKNFEDKLIHL